MMLSFTEIKLNGRNARDSVVKAMRILLCKYIIKEWLSSKTMTIRMLVLLLIIILIVICKLKFNKNLSINYFTMLSIIL
jgi:hypothetical protein